MGRKNDLSFIEKTIIDSFLEANMSHTEISKRVNRARSTISSYANYKHKRGSKETNRGKLKTTKRDKRYIFRLATKEKLSTRQIQSSLDHSVSHMTVYRCLKANRNTKFGKLKLRTALTPPQVELRKKWSKVHQTWTHEWDSVIFTDEKKWNADGPDGYKYVWQDKRANETLSKLPNTKTSLMVWGAISHEGVLFLKVVDGNLNSNKYQSILQEFKSSLEAKKNVKNWVLQQDNAPSHVSKSTKTWFEKNSVATIEWPSASPDLNPIENLWGYLSSKVYNGGVIYKSKENLKRAIFHEWSKITPQYTDSLVKSMPDRVCQLISKNGQRIPY